MWHEKFKRKGQRKMSKNINLANSKLNNSNIKLKQSYSNAKTLI